MVLPPVPAEPPRVTREQQLLRDGGGGVDDLAAEVPPLPRLQLLCALPKARLR